MTTLESSTGEIGGGGAAISNSEHGMSPRNGRGSKRGYNYRGLVETSLFEGEEEGEFGSTGDALSAPKSVEDMDSYVFKSIRIEKLMGRSPTKKHPKDNRTILEEKGFVIGAMEDMIDRDKSHIYGCSHVNSLEALFFCAPKDDHLADIMVGAIVVSLDDYHNVWNGTTTFWKIHEAHERKKLREKELEQSRKQKEAMHLGYAEKIERQQKRKRNAAYARAVSTSIGSAPKLLLRDRSGSGAAIEITTRSCFSEKRGTQSRSSVLTRQNIDHVELLDPLSLGVTMFGKDEAEERDKGKKRGLSREAIPLGQQHNTIDALSEYPDEIEESEIQSFLSTLLPLGTSKKHNTGFISKGETNSLLSPSSPSSSPVSPSSLLVNPRELSSGCNDRYGKSPIALYKRSTPKCNTQAPIHFGSDGEFMLIPRDRPIQNPSTLNIMKGGTPLNTTPLRIQAMMNRGSTPCAPASFRGTPGISSPECLPSPFIGRMGNGEDECEEPGMGSSGRSLVLTMEDLAAANARKWPVAKDSQSLKRMVKIVLDDVKGVMYDLLWDRMPRVSIAKIHKVTWKMNMDRATRQYLQDCANYREQEAEESDDEREDWETQESLYQQRTSLKGEDSESSEMMQFAPPNYFTIYSIFREFKSKTEVKTAPSFDERVHLTMKEYILRCWMVLSREEYASERNQRKASLFSFIVGLLYLMAEGGYEVDGAQLVPYDWFVKQNLPNEDDLDTLDGSKPAIMDYFHLRAEKKTAAALANAQLSSAVGISAIDNLKIPINVETTKRDQSPEHLMKPMKSAHEESTETINSCPSTNQNKESITPTIKEDTKRDIIDSSSVTTVTFDVTTPTPLAATANSSTCISKAVLYDHGICPFGRNTNRKYTRKSIQDSKNLVKFLFSKYNGPASLKELSEYLLDDLNFHEPPPSSLLLHFPSESDHVESKKREAPRSSSCENTSGEYTTRRGISEFALQEKKENKRIMGISQASDNSSKRRKKSIGRTILMDFDEARLPTIAEVSASALTNSTEVKDSTKTDHTHGISDITKCTQKRKVKLDDVILKTMQEQNYRV